MEQYATQSELYRDTVRATIWKSPSLLISGRALCSFIFGVLETLIVDMDRAGVTALQERLRQVGKEMPEPLLLVGAARAGRAHLDRILRNLHSFMTTGDVVYDVTDLWQDFQDAATSDAVVQYMRCVTAHHIIAEEAHFLPFLASLEAESARADGCAADAVESCERHVLGMGTEAEHMCVLALAAALRVAVAVLYTAGEFECKVHAIDPADVGSPTRQRKSRYSPGVFLLYRSGHYEIIYPSDSSWQALLAGSEFGFAERG